MEINKIREKIDSLDNQLTELFIQRMNLSKEVAEYKRDNKISVLDKTREREILSKVSQKAGVELESYIRVLYSSIFDVSRSYQKNICITDNSFLQKLDDAIKNTPCIFPKRATVACQGIDGSYSQLACDKMFTAAEIMFFNQFDKVFKAVESGLCQYGILPIENSTAGSVNDVYDLMKKHDFKIVKSAKLHISHCLVANSGTKLENVKEILSHEQAFSQCSDFINNLKDVKITICENTAIATKAVADSDRNDIAAISSKNCAELYGLDILSSTVQNSENNYTRFICISKNLEIFPGADRTSLMLTVPHSPGSLFKILARFNSLEINLIKLESRPLPGTNFEFMFYFDIQASINDISVKKLLCEFESEFENYTYLGSYSEVV